MVQKMINGFQAWLLSLDKEARDAKGKEIKALMQELKGGQTTVERKAEIMARLSELNYK
jgi:hypothetical protein